MNYFELFGLLCHFKLDTGSLALKFRELQRRFHPDRFTTASEQDRLLAVQKASFINEAYQTLHDPVRRAEYMLSLNELDLYNEQQTMQESTFLMQQMKLRAELNEIAESNQVGVLLFNFEQKTTAIYNALLLELENELRDAKWATAATLVHKLKFLVKLKQEIERIEDRLLC
ncbi:co-chaperone HscB [Candidatus Enterovibrio altilux]|uniref:Co-chaperone protein HscB homolog n=1 Tax=Candidatus Enterovibrio altilux TaxID=1927128 RepID=A0A291BB48_9GAMM|nr:co-chaperone HscB [Candidatus Enterovibrio luxaltus]ATF10240.1 Chaperone protein HscB [Candidatus Enterovibrio luxaltus]